MILWVDLEGSEISALPCGQASPMPLAPGTSLSSSDLLSVCPFRLEKPNGKSNFFLTAITSLAERLREIIGSGLDSRKGGSKAPPGRV